MQLQRGVRLGSRTTYAARSSRVQSLIDFKNSDFPLTSATVATNTIRKVVERRGDRNVPKRYLKAAKWTPEDDLHCGEGYYVIDPDDDKDSWIPVDFDFEALQWGTT